MGQVHRFHDTLAIWSGNGMTSYVKVDEAEALGNAILKIVASIRDERFADSSGLTHSFKSQPDTFGITKIERDKDGRAAERSPEPAFVPMPLDLITAARDVISAFGGDVPDWLDAEIGTLEDALKKFSVVGG